MVSVSQLGKGHARMHAMPTAKLLTPHFDFGKSDKCALSPFVSHLT